MAASYRGRDIRNHPPPYSRHSMPMAKSLGLSQGAVSGYLSRARAAGVELSPLAMLQEIGFASDSPLEGNGFELPVPVRQAKLTRFCR